MVMIPIVQMVGRLRAGGWCVQWRLSTSVSRFVCCQKACGSSMKQTLGVYPVAINYPVMNEQLHFLQQRAGLKWIA
jgi:hypothetical protein